MLLLLLLLLLLSELLLLQLLLLLLGDWLVMLNALMKHAFREPHINDLRHELVHTNIATLSTGLPRGVQLKVKTGRVVDLLAARKCIEPAAYS